MTIPAVTGIIGLILLVSFCALLLRYPSGLYFTTTTSRAELLPPLIEKHKKQQPNKAKTLGLKFQITRQKQTIDEFGLTRAIPSQKFWGSRQHESFPVAILSNRGVGSKGDARTLPLRFENEGFHFSTYKIISNNERLSSFSSWILTYIWHCRKDKFSAIPTGLFELEILQLFSNNNANGVFTHKLIYRSDPVVVETVRGNNDKLDLSGVETKLKDATKKCSDGTHPIVDYFIMERSGQPISTFSNDKVSPNIAIQIAVVLISLLKDLHTGHRLVHGNINPDTVWVEDGPRVVLLTDWSKARRVSENWGIVSFAKKIKRKLSNKKLDLDNSQELCNPFTRNSLTYGGDGNYGDDIFAVFMTVVIVSQKNNSRIVKEIESVCKKAVESGDHQAIAEYFEWKRNLNPFDFSINQRGFVFSDNLLGNAVERNSKREILQSVFKSIKTPRTDFVIPYDFIIKQLESVVL